MIRYLRRKAAQRRLARMVAEARRKFETQDYAKRRAAALKSKRVSA